jgi:hypothetical protein
MGVVRDSIQSKTLGCLISGLPFFNLPFSLRGLCLERQLVEKLIALRKHQPNERAKRDSDGEKNDKNVGREPLNHGCDSVRDQKPVV